MRPNYRLISIFVLGCLMGLMARDTVESGREKLSHWLYNPDGGSIPIDVESCTTEGTEPQKCKKETYNMKMNLYGPSVDGFINITEFCDIRDDFPISDKCIGFIGGIVEVKKTEDLYARIENWPHHGEGACIPREVSVADIFKRIRPYLRKQGYGCMGQCDSASYVEGAINAAFPCS